VYLAMAAAITLILLDSNIQVLNPKGEIGFKQRQLIIVATLLMLIVAIPVIVLTFVFDWKYREGSRRAKYTPDWDRSPLIESLWWGVPGAIVVVLAIIAWKSSHELDPFKPLEASAKPLKVQVVALQWKWLFIYPEQNIATVNFVQFPEQTPIDFEITADAPMNSFWIPQLGGQVYAMPGMKTKLHLIANAVGTFKGCSANLSGEGFAGMTFTAKSCSEAEFEHWVALTKQSSNSLDADVYFQLAEPSRDNVVKSYLLLQEDLYDQIVMKYMMPMHVMNMP
jgi:cytochrome o ubiquinol oxidase subunit 2